MTHKVVDMSGNAITPMEEVKTPPQLTTELLMSALTGATAQWRSLAAAMPNSCRVAMVDGSGYAATIRSMRRDLDFIERALDGRR